MKKEDYKVSGEERKEAEGEDRGNEGQREIMDEKFDRLLWKMKEQRANLKQIERKVDKDLNFFRKKQEEVQEKFQATEGKQKMIDSRQENEEGRRREIEEEFREAIR